MLKLEYKSYVLDFKFVAGTSRGEMAKRKVWFVKIYHSQDPKVYGMGEVAPLPGLSMENIEQVSSKLEEIKKSISLLEVPHTPHEVYGFAKKLAEEFPSIRMGIEMALLDLVNGGRQKWFDSSFTSGDQTIPINGLIWMGEEDFMRQQVEQKIKQGYQCIKMKIGAIDFDKELHTLEFLRSFSDEIIIRLDANGAFDAENVFEKLDALSKFNIHSIEQPVRQGQWALMHKVCTESPIPVALDEELIGILSDKKKEKLLKEIQPKFIILKPSLLGGFAETSKWIDLALEKNIDWWITSALESNIGLNAIAQFVAKYPDLSYQGLGTGQLFHNNFASRANVSGGRMTYELNDINELPF